MRITFLWVGKTKNAALRTLQQDYLDRLSHLVSSAVVEVKDLSKGKSLAGENLVRAEGEALARAVPLGARVVTLEVTGRQFGSEEFSEWLDAERNSGARHLVFVIGGAEGLSGDMSRKAHMRLSLGKMTWTHEICRLLLLEQVYRAFTLLRHIPYHK